MKRKGIVLAGGAGTRLYPATKVVSKQMLPIFDKPMIYYPICTLLSAGLDDVLLISTPHDIEGYQRLLGDGSRWGISISYEIQPSPDGLAQAFILGKKFIGSDSSALILGDNIFHGRGIELQLERVASKDAGATIFAYHVKDPGRYGVVEFNSAGVAQSLEEKPADPKSNYAITGLYFYDNEVLDIAASIAPSDRGELEITDVNIAYLEKKRLEVEVMDDGCTWLDTGTHDSFIEASNFVKTLEARQGRKIACPEEIVWRRNLIDDAQLIELASKMGNSSYGKYLVSLVERKK